LSFSRGRDLGYTFFMLRQNWISDLHVRGLLPALRALLDVLEPVSPLGAQLAYLIQPTAGLFGSQWYAMLGDIGEALETPEGLSELKAQLDRLDEIDGGG